MTPEIDIPAFGAAHADGAVVIDVRESFEYAMGHVPGATLVPLSRLPGRVGELPRDEPVYVICATGNRSLHAADHLRRAGIDAISVAGGTTAWERLGHPLARGSRAA